MSDMCEQMLSMSLILSVHSHVSLMLNICSYMLYMLNVHSHMSLMLNVCSL